MSAVPFRPAYAAALLVLLAGIAVALPAWRTEAAADPVFSKDGLAIRGYDPVAYFTRGRPTAGDPAVTLEWNGALWRFESAENRDRFAADPERWAPRYGGWCAWAVSRGYTAPTMPDAWSIVDGRLYLNYSTAVRADWERDVSGNIARAEAAWPGLRGR